MIRWAWRLGDWLRHRARSKRWQADQAAGRRGEDLAHRHLARRGIRVVARNYRPPGGGGEIDLIGWDGPKLVFFEVKTRHSGDFGAPERNVDEEKRRSLFRAAREYARRAGVPWDCVRFDIVAILLAKPPSFQHFPDVFPLKS